MNIWIEGIDGSGKTTLAAALAKKLGVKPYWNASHIHLNDEGGHNVSDRHLYVTNRVYKTALPERFKYWGDVSADEFRPTNDDIFVFVKTKKPLYRKSAQDYSLKELNLLYHKYCMFFKNRMRMGLRVLIVTRDEDMLAVEDWATIPGSLLGAWALNLHSSQDKDSQVEFLAETISMNAENSISCDAWLPKFKHT